MTSCLRGHPLPDGCWYRDPVTAVKVCIACQAPMDLSLRKKGPRPGVVEPMTRSQRYYWRNRERMVRAAVARKQRRKAAV